ncbi:MAG: hypothetical protein DHS20C18_49470 [Saprospiraceae bacterium]|nr:MAG: hypothetical protein DHS20C18_49470 [Saprospiraceae bacterium]
MAIENAGESRSRFSDVELEEFKQLIEGKLEKAKEQLRTLQMQIMDTTENSRHDQGGDWMDSSGLNSELEMLNTMALRHRKHIQDLENALIRIRNKSYGVCVITGTLIDKKRLMAVPTTTKSLNAKTEEQKKAEEKTTYQSTKTPYIKGAPPKVITKVIKKKPAVPVTKVVEDEDDDYLDEDDDYLDDLDNEVDIDLDDIADEGSANDDLD